MEALTTGNGHGAPSPLDTVYTSLARERLCAELQDTQVHVELFKDPDKTYRINCFTHQIWVNQERMFEGDFPEVFARALVQLERGVSRLREKHDCGVEVCLILPARGVDEAAQVVRNFLTMSLVRMKDAVPELYYSIEGVDLGSGEVLHDE